MNLQQVMTDNKHMQLIVHAGILPAGYTQLKWLDNNVQSAQNVAAYVNTGINGLDGRTSRIEIDACWRYKTVSGYSCWNVLFAAQASDNDSGTIQIRVYLETASVTHVTLISNLNDNNSITVPAETPFHAILDKAMFTVNDTTITTTCGSTASKGPLHIGKPQWNRGSEFRYWEGLFGRCIVYDNEQLVGDLVPARRTADDVCGYYDVVRDVFLPSSNSIPFIEGTINN